MSSLAVLYSRALAGMEAPPVTVEVHLANGLPNFTIVELPEVEVKESKERVRSANCRFEFPARRITVNLAPADLPKESGRFDLPIALGILAASAQIPANKLGEYEFAGELALTGELCAIRGALTMTYNAHRSGRAFVLLVESATEASLVRDALVYPAATLLQVCAHLAGREALQRARRSAAVAGCSLSGPGGGQRAGAGQTGARGRRRRRPQRAHGWPARNRQDHRILKWRAASPISPARLRSPRRMWPKRCSTGASNGPKGPAPLR
jgi:magnesium chelatase family protein